MFRRPTCRQRSPPWTSSSLDRPSSPSEEPRHPSVSSRCPPGPDTGIALIPKSLARSPRRARLFVSPRLGSSGADAAPRHLPLDLALRLDVAVDLLAELV